MLPHRLSATLLACLGLLLAAGARAAAAPSGTEAPAGAWALPNGLRVLHAPPAPDGSAHALLFLPAGWQRDPPGARGLAELTASVAVQASREHDPRKLRSALAELGASVTAHLAADYAMVRVTAPDATRLGSALALVGEVVREPSFPPALVDASCASLLQELRHVESEPLGLAARAAAAAVAGPEAPASGLPDPWAVRRTVAGCLADFHARHWTPAGSLLVLSGLPDEAARPAVVTAFGSWPVRAVEAVACGVAPAAEPWSPATLLVTSPSDGGAVALALAPAEGGNAAADPLVRHAVIFALAQLVGAPDRVAAPFPAGLVDVLAVPAAQPARTLTLLRKHLDALATSGPAPGTLDAWRAKLAEADEVTAGTPGASAFMSGLAEWRGVPATLAAAGASVTDEAVRAAAAAFRDGGARWAVAGAARHLARVRDASVAPFRLTGPRVAADVQAADAGRSLIERALKAQGDPARLMSLSAVDERTEGMFHGIGTHVAVRTRQLISLPESVYMESAMYNHRRFIVNRLIAGEVWVDRTGIPSRAEHRFDKARLMERQALLHPAFALARASADAWMRHAGAGPDEGTEIVEVLHPVAGACRFTIRVKDLALVTVEMDLSPLEPTAEVHRYADFRVVDGIRMPFAESASAAGRPWRDVTVTSVTFPGTVDPAFFLTEGRPDPDVFDRPGPPDGKTDAEVSKPEAVEIEAKP